MYDSVTNIDSSKPRELPYLHQKMAGDMKPTIINTVRTILGESAENELKKLLGNPNSVKNLSEKLAALAKQGDDLKQGHVKLMEWIGRVSQKANAQPAQQSQSQSQPQTLPHEQPETQPQNQPQPQQMHQQQTDHEEQQKDHLRRLCAAAANDKALNQAIGRINARLDNELTPRLDQLETRLNQGQQNADFGGYSRI